MGDFFIRGGRVLSGQVNISGSKNAVLPIMAAAILTKGAVIYNCPDLSDVDNSMEILRELGCKCSLRSGVLSIEPYGIYKSCIPEGLCKKMRSSVTFMGALTALTGRAELYCPGGCTIGKRPVDMHLKALREMGAEITEAGDMLVCSGVFKGGEIILPYPSVGATENLIMAAVTARGSTTLKNCAKEPEITALCEFLRRGGAKITGDGTKTIYIQGVRELKRCEYTLIGDRIEAGTYLCAGAITGGELYVRGAEANHLLSVIRLLKRSGCFIKYTRDLIYIDAPGRLTAPGYIRTAPYPCVPTDIQPQLTALSTLATGETRFVEGVFENRLGHIGELKKMGADISCGENNSFTVRGADTLTPAVLEPKDLRAGAAMVIAALGARGESIIKNTHFIKRGYEAMPQKLKAIGADIAEL